MTCRCPGTPWPVLRATWRAGRLTVDRRHHLAACGLPAEPIDPRTGEVTR